MKRIFFVFFCVTLFITSGLWAQEQRGVSFGIRILAGGRYDNVRMCVGSPAGVPGGPIGEVYFDIRVPVSDRGTVVVNLPLFRPIMFAAAFDILQLEPTVMYEHRFGEEGGTQPVVGGGLGTIFHYGPDYNSSQENRGDSFFSVGPLVSGFAGLKFAETNFTAGVKGFFSPLFTANQSTGVVAGGGVELNYNFE
ncbi:MAG: hypothetical protein U5P10_12885 [Spirochaetia bacterium]|nr:hypothetical protein [Spirochaetia bacterium]